MSWRSATVVGCFALEIVIVAWIVVMPPNNVHAVVFGAGACDPARGHSATAIAILGASFGRASSIASTIGFAAATSGLAWTWIDRVVNGDGGTTNEL